MNFDGRSVIAHLFSADLMNIEAGETLLHKEAVIGNHESCYLLLHRAAQVGCRKELLATMNSCGKTALHVACEQGHLDVARLLIEAGSLLLLHLCQAEDILIEVRNNDHPFELARKGRHLEICELIMEWRNSIINQSDIINNNMYFLHDTVTSRDLELVDRLISRGLLAGDLELLSTATTQHKKSCLDIACIDNNIAMVTLLVEKYKTEVCINSFNEACRYGSVELVRFLMNHASNEVINADIPEQLDEYDEQDYEGCESKADNVDNAPSWSRNSYDKLSSIEIACTYNRMSIVQLLLHERRETITSDRACSALQIACENGNQSLAKFLIEAGVKQYNINKLSTYTILMASAELGIASFYHSFKYRPVAVESTFLVAHVELDLPYHQEDGNKLIEHIIQTSSDVKEPNQQISFFSLCMNSGVDVLTRLWHYHTKAALITGSEDTTINDDVIFALIEMDALNSCYATTVASISENLYSKTYDTSYCILLGWIFLSYIHLKKYDMLKAISSACPLIFCKHRFCPPVKNLDNEFIANVIIGCGLEINAIMTCSLDKTILMETCSKFLVEGVQMLLAAGANMNQQDRDYSSTCLHHVAIALGRVVTNKAEKESKARDIIILLKSAGMDATIEARCPGLQNGKRTAKKQLEEYKFLDLAALL